MSSPVASRTKDMRQTASEYCGIQNMNQPSYLFSVEISTEPQARFKKRHQQSEDSPFRQNSTV